VQVPQPQSGPARRHVAYVGCRTGGSLPGALAVPVLQIDVLYRHDGKTILSNECRHKVIDAMPAGERPLCERPYSPEDLWTSSF
jgi:hypothetical protein